MVLITIVSLSWNSDKLGSNFNCDINLLKTMPLLLISTKKSTTFQLIGYTCRFLNKRWILLWKSVKEISPQVTTSESTKSGQGKLISSRFTEKHFQIHNVIKNELTRLSLQVPKKYTPFYSQRTFFKSASALFNFLMNWTSSVA